MSKATVPAGRCALDPIHPGALLREDVLPALGISVASAAASMKVSRQMLHRVISEKASITPDMALRLGKFCGNGPGLWLRMQATYDLWVAGRKSAALIRSIPTMKVETPRIN